jgi:hypothetical protein
LIEPVIAAPALSASQADSIGGGIRFCPETVLFDQGFRQGQIVPANLPPIRPPTPQAAAQQPGSQTRRWQDIFILITMTKTSRPEFAAFRGKTVVF